MNKKIIAIDFGTKLIGISITDEKNKFAIGYSIEKNDKYFIKTLKSIIDEEKIKTIVIGYPKTHDNYVSERHKLINDFSDLIQKKINDIDIVLFDESYTTSTSIYLQKKVGIKNSQIKKTKDMSSAVLILDGYLQYIKNNKKQ